MVTIENKSIYRQDSERIDDELIKKFNLTNEDIRVSNGNYVFDFVGFSINSEENLIVFPKNYFGDDSYHRVEKPLINDTKLLFDVIYHYITTNNIDAKALKYSGMNIHFLNFS